jgi:hypothetical protein
LLGNGDGSFQPQQFHPTILYPHAIAQDDMNGDGLLDVVVINTYDFNISILLGNSDGSLQTQKQNFQAGNHPHSLSIGDLNGDGHLDVVVADYADEEISILLGNGNGSLKSQQRFPVGEVQSSITLGDVNRDGSLDIGVGLLTGEIVILYGYGNGSFQEYRHAITRDQISWSISIIFNDFNGDGLLDIVHKSNRSVSVRFGDGEGGFSTQHQVSTTGNLVEMTDLNEDGWIDALIVTGNDQLSVLHGRGDGSFELQLQSHTIDQLLDIVDMNGDGRLDIVTFNNAGRLSVLLGEGDGSFQEAAQTDTDISFRNVSLGDMDADGILDAVGVIDNSDPSDSSLLLVLIGNVDGTFRERYQSPPRGNLFLMGLSDINGDKMLDVVLDESFGNIKVLLGNGDGAFEDQVSVGFIKHYYDVIFRDINGDGRGDLVMYEELLGSRNVLITVHLGSADGSLHRAMARSEARWYPSTALGDLNRDGYLDMLVHHGYELDIDYLHLQHISVNLVDANGDFSQVRDLHVASGHLDSMQLADVNDDGLLDMVSFSSLGNMAVLLGNGDGSFQPAQHFQIDNFRDTIDSVFLVDVNGDYNLDVVLGYLEDFTVILNQGGI